MREQRVPHTLVVEVTPCPECQLDSLCVDCQEYPDASYAIECPGVSDHCEMWLECAECPGAMSDEQSEQLWEEGEAHGVEHQHIDGMWMTRTGSCFVQLCDGMPEAVAEAVAEIGNKPGRYLVDHDFPGDGVLSLAVLGEAP